MASTARPWHLNRACIRFISRSSSNGRVISPSAFSLQPRRRVVAWLDILKILFPSGSSRLIDANDKLTGASHTRKNPTMNSLVLFPVKVMDAWAGILPRSTCLSKREIQRGECGLVGDTLIKGKVKRPLSRLSFSYRNWKCVNQRVRNTEILVEA